MRRGAPPHHQAPGGEGRHGRERQLGHVYPPSSRMRKRSLRGGQVPA